jgi:glycosyltransferase involved in cell wall biosynthesis
MSRRYRIAIATGGRFHVLDLARELDTLGHDVRFYSYVPRDRAEKFGLPRRCHVSLLPLLWPLVGWERKAGTLLPGVRELMWRYAVDGAVMARLKPCDVYIGMSGQTLEAASYARRRFGALIYLERGSRHIRSQKEILAAIPGSDIPSDFAIRLELAGYQLADRIVVPSAQVVESFREQDAALVPKLFVNTYGVDLNQFPQRPMGRSAGRVALFVGSWTLRKGVDVLVEAVMTLEGVQLVHVGPLGNVPFPAHPRFTHHDAVQQLQLKDFYAAADVFVLASREEGLALVQAQALACGLPVVCTDRTGGADLAHTPALAKRINVVPHDDAAKLAAAIRMVLDSPETELPPLEECDRQHLAWASYGKRYAREIEARLKG